tara:strand:- start:79483 stop:79953 length:471 start_codon:yes stop_codon:yes gene_type:complete
MYTGAFMKKLYVLCMLLFLNFGWSSTVAYAREVNSSTSHVSVISICRVKVMRTVKFFRDPMRQRLSLIKTKAGVSYYDILKQADISSPAYKPIADQIAIMKGFYLAAVTSCWYNGARIDANIFGRYGFSAYGYIVKYADALKDFEREVIRYVESQN